LEAPPEEFDTRHLAMMLGGGAVVVLAVVVLGFKLFGSKSEAPSPAAPAVVHAPEYPQEVVDLVAQTESALKADNFKGARTNVDKLRQLAPSHPRLAFFDGLLAQRSNVSKGNATSAGSGRGTAKRNGQSSRRSASNAAPDEKTNVAAATAGSASAPHTPALAPETPPGLTRPAIASAATLPPHDIDAMAAGSAPVATTASALGHGSEALAAAGSALPTPASSADAAPPAPTHGVSTSPARQPSSGEPPPVVQEAKLIRRVTPDYPSAAKRDGIEGSVDLEVTISSRGVVEDVSVVHATPPDMFEKSAVAAVRKWKYDPRFVDGLPSETHVKVHLEFGPGK
jgi:protein TonB